MRRALGYSCSLHLLAAGLLALARGGIVPSPNVVMVDWIESAPALSARVAPSRSAVPAVLKPAAVKAQAPADSESSEVTKSLTESPADTVAHEEARSAADSRRLTLEEEYVAGVRRALERKKIYPPLAKRLGQTGRVTLRFELARDGKVTTAELLGASPYPVLNEAAVQLLAVASFQPFPAELSKNSWEFTMPVEYRLD